MQLLGPHPPSADSVPAEAAVGRYSFSFAVASGQALFIAPVMAGEAPLVKARGFGHDLTCS